MGQSQPQKIAPPPPVCSSSTSSSSMPFINSDRVEQLKKSSLINKLANPKMFPNKIFHDLIESKSDLKSVEKYAVYNYENCSIFEKELPDELFICILGFLMNHELFKLQRVSKNFKYYWTQNSFLWRGRLLDDYNKIFMYFKPIMQSPNNSIVYYHHFIQTILSSYKEKSDVPNSMICKQVLMGMDQCGKSELAKLFSDSTRLFDSKYSRTIGVEFYSKGYEYNNNLHCKIQLWDTGGHARFQSIASAYKRGSKTIIYCFDLSDEESFDRMKELIDNNSEKPQNTPWNDYLQCERLSMIIIGLKRDLVRKVKMSRIENLLQQFVPIIDGISLKDLKVQYFELSCKTDARCYIQFPLLFGLLMSEEVMIEDASIDKKVMAEIKT
ncbi:rab family member [Naegleria gruberi]|uniref:Rab family member n=1 Tax=Naegleria gruberi TaxID=5762 RepID=D2VP41_NAEGR|nr:rab family member [Naegleria gruberi]EFC41291.1 rab family member [Naegleria gruberi]|eukprot:XP_002674035.1 rab family member [Naegleria gruberi strain NEG-M]